MAETKTTQSKLAFAKQFLISEKTLSSQYFESMLPNWRSLDLAAQKLFIHPSTEFARDYHAQSEIICLGHILDPDQPAFDNQQIVVDLNRRTLGFAQLEQCLNRKAGRWIIIARYGANTFLYHDAGGLKTVFRYFDTSTQRYYLGSQPQLFSDLLGASRFPERDEAVRKTHAGQWPPYFYPFNDVVQVLPNHRVSLNDYRIERYWPQGSLPAMSLEAAAGEMARYLERVIEASSRRYQGHIALTGGYDSRLLASCARRANADIKYFNLKYRRIPRHDVVIPERVAALLNIDYRVFNEAEASIDCLDLLEKNSSYMCVDKARMEVGNLARAIGDGVYLQGMVGEVVRCFYDKRDSGGLNDAKKLCRLMLFPEANDFERGLQEWLGEVPATNVDPLDLLYWECRVGIWGAAAATFKEAMVEIWPPFNCRHLLALGLAVERRYRVKPYALFREIMRRQDPRLLAIDFNATRMERIRDGVNAVAPLPWRVKKKLRLV